MCRILILAYLWGISFHALVVFALGKNLLFKSVLGHCDLVNFPCHQPVTFAMLFFGRNCSLYSGVIVEKSQVQNHTLRKSESSKENHYDRKNIEKSNWFMKKKSRFNVIFVRNSFHIGALKEKCPSKLQNLQGRIQTLGCLKNHSPL